MADSSMVKELTEKLEQGIKDLFTSERYAEYLKSMSRFHHYSTRNIILIHMQMPGASKVASYLSWKKNFNRHVKKGEHGLKIFAPVGGVKKVEADIIDPLTQRPIIGEDGEPLREEIEISIPRYKVVTTFDIAQTEGEPIPSLVQDLSGDVEQYTAFMDALHAVSPLPIVFEEIKDGSDGYCEFGVKIAIREGMSQVQTVCAVIHEITHAKLHDIESIRMDDIKAVPKDRRTREIEAESVAFSVSAAFQVETGANSFGYIGTWSESMELKELKASLDTIRKAAAELIDAIDSNFQQIIKERGIILESVGESLTQDETLEISVESIPPALNETPETVQNEFSQTPPAPSDLPEPPAAAPSNIQPEAILPEPPETPEENDNVSAIINLYARSDYAGDPRRVGSVILMTPLFIDGNLNRDDKKIRVTVEEPAGKYHLFSRMENGEKSLYYLSAVGRIDRTAEYFRDDWDEKNKKYVSHRPAEAEFDAIIPKVAELFESDMADPAKWAKYQYAALLDRLDECDIHNAPVRVMREEESRNRREEAERERQEEQIKIQEKLISRVDAIADAIEKKMSIDVSYKNYTFLGKNPVLELFKLYDINLPLKTQGWVNTGLAAVTPDGYRYYSGKNKRNSTTFGGYLLKLREAIKETPIRQKRGYTASVLNNAELTAKENSVMEPTDIEHRLYKRFSELFPRFMSGEYSKLQLEAPYAKPLTLEWIFGDMISISHTYEQPDGSPGYDPYVMLGVNSGDKTMSASVFDLTDPPRHDVVHGEEGFTNTAMQKNISDFTLQWLDRIEKQGFVPVHGTVLIGENDIPVTVGTDGRPVFPEQNTPEKNSAAPEKVYDLGYGFLGNGLTVWNRAEEENGDYKTVAHIAPDRTVTFYDKDMPHAVKQQIDTVANSPDTRAFGFAPAPANIPPRAESLTIPTTIHEAVWKFPDPAIGYSEMNLYGYKKDDMLPLTAERAVELFNAGCTVYILEPDNTEIVALDTDEIISESGGKVFGITKADWEMSPEYAANKTAAAKAESTMESELLYGNGNRFGIYQVRDNIEEPEKFNFTPLQELADNGLAVNRANYELVYTAPLAERIEFLSDRYPVLQKIYSQFNAERPEDYKGRSVSVSDVIVMKYNGDIASFYVDDKGFHELDAFIGDETQWVDALKREQERNGSAPEQSTDAPRYSPLGNTSEAPSTPSAPAIEPAARISKMPSIQNSAPAVQTPINLAAAPPNQKQNNNRNITPKAKRTLMERLAVGKQKAATSAKKPQQPSNGRRNTHED